MHTLGPKYAGRGVPKLIAQSEELVAYIRTLSPDQLAKSMAINNKLAATVAAQYASWNSTGGSRAIHTFAGDIYSGLQVQTWSETDFTYADNNLRILSGLYGVLKPSDAIQPYRLEAGYKLPDEPFRNLYQYWGDRIAHELPESQSIIDLTAKEYSKLITPYIPTNNFICPKFMTISPRSNEPTFVVVHAKIARGAFARWLIQNQVNQPKELTNFAELGYQYAEHLSTPEQPVYVCKEFGGLGLSVRLQHK